MGRFLVIENEPKFIELIQETLKSLDNTADVVQFDTFTLLDIKLNQLTPADRDSFLKFDLILLNFSDRAAKEWLKSLEEFKKKLSILCPICLSTYENSALSLAFLKQLGVYNVIFKPFDALILKETLFLALQKDKLGVTKEIKSQKSSNSIGVLKEVELQAISELGFITISDAAIPLMSLTKYSSSLFEVGRKKSVWAQCLTSAAHPQKAGFFINKFQFYYVKKDFLNHMRRYINNFKQQETSSALWNLSKTHANTKKIKLALIGLNNSENQNYQKEILSHFKNIEVEFFDVALITKWPASGDFQLVLNISDLEFEQIKKSFTEKTVYFWMPRKEINEEALVENSVFYQEIFTEPHDRSYFYKKLKVLANELIPSEAPYLLSITCHDKIKAINTIKVTEINEVYINFQYSRELDLNTFREFLFVIKSDEAEIEVPAFCHYREKSKNLQAGEKNLFFHQFAFFGMSDHFLKEIRLWLLHNHVIQNKKE